MLLLLLGLLLGLLLSLLLFQPVGKSYSVLWLILSEHQVKLPRKVRCLSALTRLERHHGGISCIERLKWCCARYAATVHRRKTPVHVWLRLLVGGWVMKGLRLLRRTARSGIPAVGHLLQSKLLLIELLLLLLLALNPSQALAPY